MPKFRVVDPIAMDILTESFTSLASSSNPAIYQAAIISAVPALVPMLAKEDPWVVTSTLRILRALFNEAKPGALGCVARTQPIRSHGSSEGQGSPLSVCSLSAPQGLN